MRENTGLITLRRGENMIDLAWLIQTGPTAKTEAQYVKNLEKAEVREVYLQQVVAAVSGCNVTRNTIAERTGIQMKTISGCLRDLVKRGELVRWRIGTTLWYSIPKKRRNPRKQEAATWTW